MQSVPCKMQFVPNHYLFLKKCNMIDRYKKHVEDACTEAERTPLPSMASLLCFYVWAEGVRSRHSLVTMVGKEGKEDGTC